MRGGRVLLGVVAIALTGSSALAYTVARVQARAAGDVEAYLAGARTGPDPVVIAGASIVRGRAAVDFVQLLRERIPQRIFVNAGVNSNVAQQLLDRLEPILACRPAQVIILIGTNDVEMTLASEQSSFADYEQCMLKIVTALQHAGADVALCSLPPIGQDLSAEVNVRVREANRALRDVTSATQSTYLPVYEKLAEYLESQGRTTGPPWTGSWAPGLTSLIQHFLLHRSYDSISADRDWLLSPDGVHMNTRGADIIAGVVETWLNTIPVER
jgi:acyl-CoA thioesterase I